MQTLLVILAVASTLCSAFTSCVYAYLAWKKSKEPPKDELWEAATRIVCAQGRDLTGDGFAEVYEELRIFKEKHNKDYSSVDGTLAYEATQSRES